MKRRFTAICAFLLFAIPVSARSQSTQDKQNTQDKKDQDKTVPDKAQIVGTAEITKIDAKKQVLQVKNLEPASNTSTAGNNSGNPGGRRPGGGGGGGGVGFPGGGGGRRRPGGYPGGGYPGGGGGGGGYPGGSRGGGNRTGTQSQPKEYKVYVTKDTTIKLANADLAFSDLHVGDRIQVLGNAKSGNSGDLQATAITRDPQ